MGRVESSDPDVMTYRSGGGCLMIFGLPFLLAGLFVMASAFLPEKYRPKDDKTGKPMPIYFALPFGAVFAAVGAGLVLGRGGKTIDKRAGIVTTWWGLLVPFRRKDYPLSDFDRVELAKEVRRSKNSTYTVYPVRMRGGGSAKVSLEEPRDRNKARQLGEEMATFLGVKLVDSTMGAAVVREAGELDESLRERSQRTGERLEVGDAPADRRSVQSVAGDTLVFEIPPTGFKAAHLVPMVAGLIIPTIVYFVFVRTILGEGKMPFAIKALFLGFLILFFMVLPIVMTWGLALRSSRKRARVEVSPRELRVTESGLIGSHTKSIPTDELEELQVVSARQLTEGRSRSPMIGGGQVIAARSDKASLAFGAGLSRRELDWMRAVIWNIVTA